jgi:hypothetical protein
MALAHRWLVILRLPIPIPLLGQIPAAQGIADLDDHESVTRRSGNLIENPGSWL